MQSTPGSLLERLRRPDDAAAWERFVALYTPLLFHWLRRSGLNEDDASETVQDILTKLVVQLPRLALDPTKSFHGWLRTLAMNVRRDLLKKRTVVVGAFDPDADAFAPDPLEQFIEREYRQRLAVRALRILRSDFQPRTWQAVWDLVVEGKPAADVGRLSGMSVEAVYAAKCRVLSRLRRELQGLWV